MSVGLTVVSDPFDVVGTREMYRVDFAGGQVSDYLPSECLDPEVFPVLAVALNGRVLEPTEWFTTPVARRDHISAMIRPGVETLVVLVVTAIVSAWQIYDATRRAKITGHHAARRAASASKHMGDSPTYGWGGMMNVVVPGGPIQILFGRHKVAGQYIKGWPQGGVVDLILGISEGEVEGLVTGSVEINGKPETVYSSASFASQDGTTAQTGHGIFGGPSLTRIGLGRTVGHLTNPTPPNNGGYYWGSGVNYLGTGNGRLATPGGSLTQTKETVFSVDGYEIGLITGRTVPTNTTILNPAVSARVQFQFDVRERTLPAGSFGAIRTFRTSPVRVVNGLLSGATYFNIRVNGLAQSRYEVEVTLNTAASTIVPDDPTQSPVIDGSLGTPSRPNDIIWTAMHLLEFLDFDRAFPGLATLGIGDLPASTIGGVLPTVTSIWEGRKVRNITAAGPPATFSAEEYISSTIAGYTPGQNPALQILDILTNISYGAGEFIDVDEDLDIASFIVARDFCDELVSRGLDVLNPLESGTLDGNISASNQFQTNQAGIDFTDGTIKVDDILEMQTGLNQAVYRIETIVSADTLRLSTIVPPFPGVTLTTEANQTWEIRNRERRCISDIYFDGATTIWQAIEAIAKPARLAVVRSNGKIKLIPDTGAPGGTATLTTPVQVFGMGNITKFKVERMGAITANRVEVQILDQDKNWEQSIAQFENNAVQSSTKTSKLVKTKIEAFGVTRRSQATRIAKYFWVSNSQEREQIEFETDAVALPLEWGDVIQILHDSYMSLGSFIDPAGEESTRGHSGRIRDVVGNVVILDDWYTWQVGFDQFSVQRSDTDALVLLGTVPVPGEKVDRLTLGPFGVYTPVPGDLFTTDALFVDSPSPTFYRVTDITRTEDHRRKVQAVTYDPRMFFLDGLQPQLFIDQIDLAETEGV